MVTNRKVTGTAASVPGGLALGGVVSLSATLIGAMISAYIVHREMIPENGIGYCSMMILLVSAAAGAWVSANRIKHRRLYVCALSGVLYYCILLAVTALFFGGRFQGMAVTALVILAGCGCVALLGGRGESRAHRRRAKQRHR